MRGENRAENMAAGTHLFKVLSFQVLCSGSVFNMAATAASELLPVAHRN